MQQRWVWDPFIRLFHWSLVTGIVLNSFVLEEGEQAHRWVGYTLATLIALRVVWGFIGSHHARFKHFVPTPTEFRAYMAELRQGRHPHYEGHNPAGGAMIIVLLTTVALIALTGWMQETDQFWGVEWVQNTHEVLANGLLALVAVHVCAVLWASRKTGENLIKAMITGKKSGSGEGALD
ncbi:hypothetical protein WH50_13820 [Pokkaliibacter plantistimulans]|uniref:Cytochrome b561 bacterial/Ni-hydrogenase domain-containing protein n=1 Tax=Pokkaliibacter plantistimulans TaxID=1635171 RepID=A0ABX5LWH1_9GAMM|nr:cytochrome b/b6 domain-containing protein [Pokkaliibacter plantistimulans]PXF30676.1 hypothetical protein WH50_13820 [Pokkaliibacter plantistimulans]